MAKLSNQDIAEVLGEIGEYLAMQNVPFKPRAYEKASQAVAGLEEDVAELYERGGLKALEKIPGVGTSIALKIEELVRTGHLKYYEGLKKKVPVDLGSLVTVKGLGPKSIQKLYRTLGVKSLRDLERVAREGKIGKLKGFGKRTEENILKGVEFAKSAGGRFVLGFIMPEIRMVETRLQRLKEVEKVVVAGSVRRRKETVGDVDILVLSTRPMPVMDFFVKMPEIVRVWSHGETKSSVKLRSGIDVDVRVVPASSYGAALNYFTGSKDHNVALRQIAIKKGWKLNEYGLFKGEKRIAGKSEEELYRALGMDYIEPELRENTGEIEAAENHALPNLVGYSDVRGDLQVQTDWTDGSDSIEAMAHAARNHGLAYIAITDHTKRLAMTHGLDAKRLQKQMGEIDRLNKRFAGKIKILKGTECDILKDGSLDLADEVLVKLDVVGASVHSNFNLSRTDQTKRVLRAMRSPHVDILFHPTGRIIQKREPYDVDMEAVLKTAKETHTVLEIDAYPNRLDLKEEYVRKCTALGVKLAVDSDAHTRGHFVYLEYGVAEARRGWAEKKDVVNVWPLGKMVQLLKK